MSNTPNFLFYANNCPHSVKLINFLRKNRLIDGIEFCNVGNPNIKIPPFIKSVPTLYLSVDRKILVNQELFTWAQNRVDMTNRLPGDGGSNSSSVGGSNSSSSGGNGGGSSIIQIQNVDITGDENIGAYQAGEFGNFSDTYAFVNDNDAITQQSFEFLDGQSATVPTYTKSDEMIAQQQSGIGSIDPKTYEFSSSTNKSNRYNESQKKQSMDKAYEKMMAARAASTPQTIGSVRASAEGHGPQPPIRC